MIIKVSEIPDEGLSLEGTDVLSTPFQDPSWTLLALSLHLERDAADVVVTGRIGARVPQVCGRCLEPFPIDVAARVDTRFRPRPQRREEDVELGVDDLEVDFYADDSLNLATLVETETSLSLPMKPLCRADCRGLCPVCGGNRNTVDCHCEVRTPDPRLAVLKDLAARLQSR
jgi:uncharacterized protein